MQFRYVAPVLLVAAAGAYLLWPRDQSPAGRSGPEAAIPPAPALSGAAAPGPGPQLPALERRLAALEARLLALESRRDTPEPVNGDDLAARVAALEVELRRRPGAGTPPGEARGSSLERSEARLAAVPSSTTTRRMPRCRPG